LTDADTKKERKEKREKHTIIISKLAIEWTALLYRVSKATKVQPLSIKLSRGCILVKLFQFSVTDLIHFSLEEHGIVLSCL